MRSTCWFVGVLVLVSAGGPAEAAAPQAPVKVFHEPLVRYLLADLTMGGKPSYYKKWAEEEHDPESMRTLKEWEAGTRVIGLEGLERKEVVGKYGKGNRIVFRGTLKTVPGEQLMLNVDRKIQQARLRLVLAHLTLGTSRRDYDRMKSDATVARALSYWADGVRATNVDQFVMADKGTPRTLLWKGTHDEVDGGQVKLNSDSLCDEGGTRYIMADIALGGSMDFYRKVADSSHDPFSIQAIDRLENGYRIINLADFERKKVNGKTLITHKGSDQRIDGLDVKLSSD